jgi:hypothetical protein
MMNWKKSLLAGLLTALLVAGAFLLSGCSKAGSDNSDEAIRKAIEAHLANRPGLLSNDIVLDMKKVDIKGTDAQADVVFRSRSDPKASMNFHYALHNDGKGWKVNETQGSGGAAPHPPVTPPEGASQDHAPSGAPGQTQGQGQGELPPEHPKVP